jgi:prepilin-type N-terminal cleavage/methylation domain-containing protein
LKKCFVAESGQDPLAGRIDLFNGLLRARAVDWRFISAEPLEVCIAMRESGTSRRTAFTLVELLVVIVVIALLATIAVPAFRRGLALAEGSKCKSNLRFLTQAHGLYGSAYHFNKPPIVWVTSRSFGYYLASPNVRMFGQPVGQGILVSENYMPLRTILCPGAMMQDDALQDEESWAERTISGSSYSYFWRHSSSFEETDELLSEYKYTDAEREGRYGLAMDVNAQSGHNYAGAYGSQDLLSHPVTGQVNIAYSDGSVGVENNSEIILRPPFNIAATLEWWELAHQAKD